jgi:hypothetical protein
MASTTQQARTGTPNMSNSSNKSRATANGVAPRHKLSTEPRQTTRDNLTSDKQAHDRLLFLIANMVGVMATVVVKNGDKFTGVLSGASLQKENADASLFVLKMTKRIPSTSGQANGSSNTTEEYVGTGEEYIMIFSQNDIIDLSVENLSLEKSVGKNANSMSICLMCQHLQSLILFQVLLLGSEQTQISLAISLSESESFRLGNLHSVNRKWTCR